MIPPRQPKISPPPLTLAKLLIVEGDTPLHFFEALLRHLQLDHIIEIRSFGGIGDFGQYVIDLTKASDFQQVSSVGVVRDAENDAAAARASVTHALASAGLTSGRVPIVRTSIFVLPDNQTPGMLETLCMRAVQGDTGLAGAWGCVQQFFACLAQSQVLLTTTPVLAKHHAQVYLATLQKPQMFPGIAAYHDAWPFANVVFDDLKKFLHSL
jgi:hypothetical protein